MTDTDLERKRTSAQKQLGVTRTYLVQEFFAVLQKLNKYDFDEMDGVLKEFEVLLVELREHVKEIERSFK